VTVGVKEAVGSGVGSTVADRTTVPVGVVDSVVVIVVVPITVVVTDEPGLSEGVPVAVPKAEASATVGERISVTVVTATGGVEVGEPSALGGVRRNLPGGRLGEPGMLA
jgi:hypothetical protein